MLPTVLRSVPQVAYVGRDEEHAWLMASAQEVRNGQRRVVMVSGEPGVGKTRLAAHNALESHNAGFTVCWGAGAEDLGAPYGPWIQALSHYVEHAPEPVLVGHVERHGGELARLLRGSLAKRVAGMPGPQAADPETERYLLFEAVVGLLNAAATRARCCWSSMTCTGRTGRRSSLLKHVASGTADSSLLVLLTYRESEVERGHPLAGALADLHRLDGVEHRALQGLGTDEVGRAGERRDSARDGRRGPRAGGRDRAGDGREPVLRRRDPASPDRVRGDLGGGRRALGPAVLGRRAGASSELREVVCRRVERLGEELEKILTLAAVTGRTFDIELLALLDGVRRGRAAGRARSGIADVGAGRVPHPGGALQLRPRPDQPRAI